MQLVVVLAIAALWAIVLGGGRLLPSRRSERLSAEIQALRLRDEVTTVGIRSIVSRGDLLRHKTSAAVSDAVTAALGGFVAPNLLLSIGDDPNGPLPWYAFVVGATCAVGAAWFVVHRYRSTDVSVTGTVVAVTNPWRTRQIDTARHPMWRARRCGRTRCVEFVGMDFVSHVSVVALPPELIDRLGVELVDMDAEVERTRADGGGRRH